MCSSDLAGPLILPMPNMKTKNQKPQVVEVADKAMIALLTDRINRHRESAVKTAHDWGYTPQSGLASYVLYGFTGSKGLQVLEQEETSADFAKYLTAKQRTALLLSGWDIIIARKDAGSHSKPKVSLTFWTLA